MHLLVLLCRLRLILWLLHNPVVLFGYLLCCIHTGVADDKLVPAVQTYVPGGHMVACMQSVLSFISLGALLVVLVAR